MGNNNSTLTVIAKPTHDCNLQCKYCYIDRAAENGRMGDELLALTIERVSDFVDKSHWIWHGGEPLLMGLDFYSLVRDIQDFYEKRDKEFSNSIQTNATLITENFVEFVRRTRDFHPSTSVDGPEDVHNRTRVYSDGRGSFSDVMKGLRLMKGRKKGGGVICIVNAQNIEDAEGLYRFFKSERMHVKFNPLIKSGRAKEDTGNLWITPKQYGRFLLDLWEIYNEDVIKEGYVTIEIEPFIEVIGNIESRKPFGCNYSSSCRDDFISIGPQGDIYPCGRFDGIVEFWIGNVRTHSIEEATNSDVNTCLKGRGLESVASCDSCGFGNVCNSGCMHNAYLDGDVLGKDPYCVSYKMLFLRMTQVLGAEKIKLERRKKWKEKK